MIRAACAGAVALLSLIGQSVSAQPAPPAPETPISLNNRIYVDTSINYDPTYGLDRIGTVSNRILQFLPVAIGQSVPGNPLQVTRNYTVYDQSYAAGASGGLSVPVIGSVSLSKDERFHISMIDLVEASMPRRSYDACTIWKRISNARELEPDSTIMYTDHAVLVRMSYASGTKESGSAKASVGTYFSAGGDTFKDASTLTNIPMIAVTGVQFKVKDPKTFCSGRREPASLLTRFNTLSDIGGPSIIQPVARERSKT